MKYWFSPVGADEGLGAVEVIQSMLRFEPPFYALSMNTPNRYQIEVGDQLCIYATLSGGGPGGVVAHATVLTQPMELVLDKALHASLSPSETGPDLLRPLRERMDDWEHLRRYPIVMLLGDVHEYYDRPVCVDDDLFQALEAFTGNLGSFVGITKAVSEHDFRILTGQA